MCLVRVCSLSSVANFLLFFGRHAETKRPLRTDWGGRGHIREVPFRAEEFFLSYYC